MSPSEERAKAVSIVNDLDAIYSRLTPADQRFVWSWKQYLGRMGERALIGRYALQFLVEAYCKYSAQIPPARPELRVLHD